MCVDVDWALGRVAKPIDRRVILSLGLLRFFIIMFWMLVV